jgi:hypothetical protein
MGYVVPLSAIPESGDIAEGQSYMLGLVTIDENGDWSLKVPDTPASLWFVVYVFDGESLRYFVTTSASDAANVSLDINAMTELPTE